MQRFGAAGVADRSVLEEKFVKIIYIGTKDQLAEAFIERMNKEGNDVYFLSDAPFPRKASDILKHRYYKSSLEGGRFEGVLRSIAPDCVVYAGRGYMGSAGPDEQEADIALLARTLRVLAGQEGVRFILLSSVAVYGDAARHADEQCAVMPTDETGICYMREEQLVEIYRQQQGIDAVILRASQLYAEQAQEGLHDFLSEAFAKAGEGGTLSDELFYPLHVADLVDAVKRVMDYGRQPVYNVTGSFGMSRRRLYELVSQRLGVEERFSWIEAKEPQSVDSSLIKKELEWTDFRKLEDLLLRGEVTYEKKQERTRTKKADWKAGSAVRRTLENIVVFAVFLALYFLCSSHSLFAQINWMTIYVIVISLFMGIRQSSFAVVLASAAYLSAQDLSILEMTNFYSYAGSVLEIMQYVFLGLSVSYVTDILREELRDVRRELSLLGQEHEELKKINEENVLIKNEYEERLLDSKSGFPKLYNTVSRLMVLQPDRIFMEIIQVIAEMVHTDTVAVYRVNGDNPYLRLINALNERSTEGGKTWNISAYARIRSALEDGELYQGDIWNGEPAVVLPIIYQGHCVAAIMIRELPYSSQSLYYVNLLKTLSLLLRESVGRALDYEELSREERYIEGTDILKPDAFYKNVLLAREKAQKHMAEYCVLEIVYTGDFGECYKEIASKLRTTDYFGADKDGKIYVLLNNTGTQDIEYLKERLTSDHVEVRLTTAFDEMDDVKAR